MPAKLINQQFPVVYGPWYVYEVLLNPVRKVFKYDVITPQTTGGTPDRSIFEHPTNTDGQEINLLNGYLISSETVEAGTEEVRIQVAAPGSVVPAIADNVATGIAPGSLLKAVYKNAVDGVLVQPCTAANLAAGLCIGRLRARSITANFLEKTSAAGKDVILLHTGVV